MQQFSQPLSILSSKWKIVKKRKTFSHFNPHEFSCFCYFDLNKLVIFGGDFHSFHSQG